MSVELQFRFVTERIEELRIGLIGLDARPVALATC